MSTYVPEIIADTFRPEGNIFLTFVALSDSGLNYKLAVLVSENLTEDINERIEGLVDSDTEFDSADCVAIMPYNLYLRILQSEGAKPKLTPSVVAKSLGNPDLFLEYPGLMEEMKLFSFTASETQEEKANG